MFEETTPGTSETRNPPARRALPACRAGLLDRKEMPPERPPDVLAVVDGLLAASRAGAPESLRELAPFLGVFGWSVRP